MDKRHRVFIAINLPENIRKKLADFKEKWPELPAKWARQENIHITLAFLGYITDEEILEVCKITEEIAIKHSPFYVKLNKVCYGPLRRGSGQALQDNSGQAPRMVWAEGEKSTEVSALKEELENALLESEKVSFSPENRAFSPHITLARISQWQFKRINPEEVPQIDENIDFNFLIESIEVMESELKKGGPRYNVLELAPLKDE